MPNNVRIIRDELMEEIYFPLKDFISFLFTMKGICVIYLTLSGSTLIKILEIMWPEILPSEIAKILFLGLRYIDRKSVV